MNLPNKMIFTVATGRCGTRFLTELLSICRGVTAEHEATPDFVDIMSKAVTNPSLAKEFWLEKKLPHIESLDAKIYAETSHLTCKGFLNPLLEMGIQPAIIYLRREPRAVAKSMYALNAIPHRTELGVQYYLSPTNFSFMNDVDWHSWSDYQLCYWYCLMIDHFAIFYKQRCKELNLYFLKTDINELKTLTGFLKLNFKLGLPIPSPYVIIRWSIRRNTRINNKDNFKEREYSNIKFDQEEKVVNDALGAVLVNVQGLGLIISQD